MATKTIPKTSDREAQRADLIQTGQNILDSGDKELIAALLVLLGSLEDSLQRKEGGAA